MGPLGAFLDRVPWLLLVVVAVLLGLAPFGGTPHLVEKLKMLAQGTLRRPIDVFDLVLHGTPLVLVILKGAREIALRLGLG